MAPLNLTKVIIGYYRRSKGSSYEDHNNRCKDTFFITSISFPLFSFYFLFRYTRPASYGGHILLPSIVAYFSPPRVWLDPLRAPAGVGKQKRPAFDR